MRAETSAQRARWVSYVRVSTTEQADRDLSLPAQRAAIEAFARRHGHEIAHEYAEAGCSGTDVNRKAFREMLKDALRAGADVSTIVVHHTSRFSRNATQARVIKERLRREGVRVVAVCQETHDDAFGNLIEGVFECIDQYESEVNGARTSAAMREAVKQGYYPGSMAPYGYRKARVPVRPGLMRHVLVPDECEAPVVRDIWRLTVTHGALGVAQELNRCGISYRGGRPWNKEDVLDVLDETAHTGTLYWGKNDRGTRRRRATSECVPLAVEPNIDPALAELVRAVREERRPSRNPGSPPSDETLLSRLIRCARCGAAYRLETSGKVVDGDAYRYRYYNCRTSTRIGKAACPGGRIRTDELDAAVLDHMIGVVCTPERTQALLRALASTRPSSSAHAGQVDERIGDAKEQIRVWVDVAERSAAHGALAARRIGEIEAGLATHEQAAASPVVEGAQPRDLASMTPDEVRAAWSSLLRARGVVSRNYLHHLIERIEIADGRILVVPRASAS